MAAAGTFGGEPTQLVRHDLSEITQSMRSGPDTAVSVYIAETIEMMRQFGIWMPPTGWLRNASGWTR